MVRVRPGSMLAVLAFVASLMVQAAHGDVFRDIALGLGYANFNIEGGRNVLSGGTDLLINNNFQGNPLDFGAAELTLQGPVSLSVSTGGRFLSELEVSLRTALDANAPAAPLYYLWDLDVGGQESQIAGNLYADANLTLNGFGFYDLQLTYSSRQTVFREGRFADDRQDLDFDVGPISIRGNIFADALALLTDPFFEATNRVNIFESFSGRVQLEEIARASTADALAKLADGASQKNDRLFLPACGIGPLAPGEGGSDPSLAFGTDADASSRAVGSIIPEPAVLLLMLLGVPVVLLKPLRHRHVTF